MSLMPMPTARIIKRVNQLLTSYDVVFCDVWGVVHDGRRAYEAAGDALERFRAGGGTVVLVSNAPTPRETVTRLLDEKGVRRSAWDGLVTSGDIAREHLTGMGYRRVHHIGPDRDLSLFETLQVERVGLQTAEAIVATGLVDDGVETAENYRDLLTAARARELPLVCANPDLVVEVDGTIYPCAGAIAHLYEQLDGRVYWAGKPHRIAYEMASQVAERIRGEKVEASRILAIGDAVRTDLAGAKAFGIHSLFVAGGIHRLEVMPHGYVDPRRLERLLAAPAPWPVAVIDELAW